MSDTATVKAPSAAVARTCTAPTSVNLMALPSEVQEYLRQAPLVTLAGWRSAGSATVSASPFSTARDSTALKTVCTTSARE